MKVGAAVAAMALASLLAVPSFAAADKDQEPPSIIVHGEGRVLAKPDLATVDIGVVSEAPKASQALAANSSAMSELLKTIYAQGIAEADAQTSTFSVSPTYTDGSSGKAPKITGYRVSNSATVKVRKVSNVGSLLDAVVQSGANSIGSIEFSCQESSKLLDAARKQAIEDARRKAVLYADAAGVHLGKVLNVIEGAVPAPRLMMTRFADASEAAPIAPGEQELKVDTTVVFAIE